MLLTPRLQLQLGDITTMNVDAIVNSTGITLLDGGPVHRAVHKAAGPALAKACAHIGGCYPGEVQITPGYKLRAHTVIHTVAPMWLCGDGSEVVTLTSCYLKALQRATEWNLTTVAFPSIGSGRQPQIPLIEAAPIAINTILSYLETHSVPEKVILVCYDTHTYRAYQRVMQEIHAP